MLPGAATGGDASGGREGGKGGDDPPRTEVITNVAFLQAVYQSVPSGGTPVVCSKPGDPSAGGWHAMPASAAHTRCLHTNNNYLNCASFRLPTDGEVRARKDQFSACHFILLDDLGSKVPFELLGNLKPSWVLETSPGNFQAGILFEEPLTEQAEAEALLAAIIDAGLCDPGAGGAASRWARLPIGINGKAKYRDESGGPFKCRLAEWCPERRYTVSQIVETLKLDLGKQKRVPRAASPTRSDTRGHNPAFTPAADENPVLSALKARGLYKRLLAAGKHETTCPWVDEHTDGLDTGAAYFEPDDDHPVGGFCCQHSHREQYHVGELLRFLELDLDAARNRPEIRVAPGGLHSAVDAAERVLADSGRFYQAGGLIATIGKDPVSGDPKIIPANGSSLTLELSRLADWKAGKDATRCDPPIKHVKALFESQSFRYLPALTGFARQPYFRETDGELVTTPGFDPDSGRYATFDTRKYTFPAPSRAEAERALEVLRELLTEFHFATEQDRAVTLSAFLTAAVRPTLSLAPAFHVQASTPGSGKTYLCELIGAFAGPAPNQKVTYPTSAEEASKMMLAVLLPGPAVVEFDDMDGHWFPYSAIKRALTADRTSDRILGVSKTATVSTRTLFLGSGNNVGPIKDLLRRVMTIRLEPQVQSPATLQYQSSPVARVRRDRERFVTATLTIIQAWRAAGAPRVAKSIATYGDAWSDYCRHPLIWLGVQDPVDTIVNQLATDSDNEILARLMTVWDKTFGSRPTTVRKVKEAASRDEDLFDAISEFGVADLKGINPNKLGQLLKRMSGRIVDRRKFQRVELSERTGWALVAAGTPHHAATLPPSPPSAPVVEELSASDELDSSFDLTF